MNNMEECMKNEFLKAIKVEEDPDRVKLLEIQDELERIGINQRNVLELTKDLTKKQKQKLENLYQEQIRSYEISVENYKNKIISIRKYL